MTWLLGVGAGALVIAAIGHIITGEQGPLKLVDSGSPAASAHVRLSWRLLGLLLLTVAAVIGIGLVQPSMPAWLVLRVIAGGTGLAAAAVLVQSRGRNPAGLLFAIASLATWFAIAP